MPGRTRRRVPASRRRTEPLIGRQEPVLLSPEDEGRCPDLLEQVLIQYPSGTSCRHFRSGLRRSDKAMMVVSIRLY
jgi:hypothetical protein